MDQNEINQYIQVLLDANSNNANLRENAQNQIQNWRENPEENVIKLAYIVCLNGIPDLAIQLSIILISQMIRPDSQNVLGEIRNSFGQNPQMSSILKSMVHRAIMSNIHSVKTYAAIIFALLVLIEEEWADGANYLISMLQQNNLSPNEKIGYIQAYYELLCLLDFDSNIILEKEAADSFIKLSQFCIEYIKMGQGNGVTIEVLIASSKSVSKVIASVRYFVFDDSHDLLMQILDSLPNSFVVGNIELFGLLLQIMSNIIKFFYHIIEKYMSIIFDYAVKCFSIKDMKYIEKIIYFWYEIAQFEYKETIFLKNRASKEIIPRVCEYIFPYFINQVQIADLNELLDSTSDTKEVVDISLMAMSAFYQCNHEAILKFFLKNFQNLNDQSPITCIYFIYALTIEPLTLQFFDFIYRNWKMLVQYAVGDGHPALINSALRTIGNLFRQYPNMINMNTLDDLSSILQKTNNGTNTDILISCTTILYSIAQIKNSLHVKKILIIDSLYPLFLGFLKMTFERNYNNFDYSLLMATTRCLNELIYAADLNRLLNPLAELFTYCEEKLRNSNQIFDSEDIRFTFQTRLISIIGFLGDKMATNNDVCQRSFNIIYSLLQNPQKLIFEEAMFAIALFIPSIGNLLSIDVTNFLIQRISESFLTKSDQTITSASILLSKLLTALPERVFNYIPDIFNSVANILINQQDLKYSRCHLLDSLSRIFLSINNEHMNIFKEQFYRIIDQMNIIISKDIDSDPEYACEAYAQLSRCIYAYFKAFVVDISKVRTGTLMHEEFEKERIYLTFLKNYAQNLYMISPNYMNDCFLNNYIDLIDEVAHKCNREHTMLLNKGVIRQPIKIAIERDNLKHKARKILECMSRV